MKIPIKTYGKTDIRKGFIIKDKLYTMIMPVSYANHTKYLPRLHYDDRTVSKSLVLEINIGHKGYHFTAGYFVKNPRGTSIWWKIWIQYVYFKHFCKNKAKVFLKYADKLYRWKKP